MKEGLIILSVIIPVYNAERLIRKTLESVLHQSLKAVEVICVDDGSTDGSVGIIREMAEKDPRITLIQQKNLYAGIARNAGIDAAKGEYLFFLDADDYVLDYALEAACNKARKHHLDCLKFLSLSYDEDAGRYVDKKRNSGGFLRAEDYDRLVKTEEGSPILKVSVAPWSGIYRREFVLGRNCRFNHLRCVNDRSFHTKVITNAERMMVSRDRVTVHRVNQAHSLVGEKSGHFECQIESIRLTERQLAEDGISPEITELIMREEYRDLTAWYFRFAEIPGRKAEMDRQIRDFLSGRKNPYDVILADMMEERRRNPPNPAAEEEVHPFHTASAQPAVSVLVPVGEGRQHLNECLDSLTRQTPEEMEFLLLDDGAAGEEKTVMREYAETDGRFIIVSIPDCRAGRLLNEGLDRARGEYIAVMDPDDYAGPGLYERLYAQAGGQRPDQVRADWVSFRRDEKGAASERPRRQAGDPALYGRILKPGKNREIFAAPLESRSVLYRKQHLKDHRIRFNEAPGTAFRMTGFQFRSLCRADRVLLVREEGYMERTDPAGTRPLTEQEESGLTGEFRFLHEWLAGEAGQKETFGGILYGVQAECMLRTWSRVPANRKLPYLRHMQEELGPAFSRGAADTVMLSPPDRERLERMMKSPEDVMEQVDISVMIRAGRDGRIPEESLSAAVNGTKAVVEVIRTEEGLSRNEGMKQAKGKYYAFLNAEDCFEEGMLDAIRDKAEEEEADITVFAGCLPAGTDPLPQSRPFSGREAGRNLFGAFCGPVQGMLFRASFVQEKGLRFAESGGAEEIPFILAAAAAADRISILEHDLPVFRGTVSEAETAGKPDPVHVLNTLRDRLKALGLYERFERDFINFSLQFILERMTKAGGEEYLDIYRRVTSGGLEDLGLTGKGRSYFYNRDDYGLLCRMKEDDPVGFLLYDLNRTREKAAGKTAAEQIPNEAVLNSLSFRIGRAVTWLPRKARGGAELIRRAWKSLVKGKN